MPDIQVLAPGSLIHLMPRLVSLFTSRQPIGIRSVFGPSGSLRAKIDAGTPFDLFLSASTTHIDDLKKEGVLGETAILGFNETVLLYPKSMALTPDTAVAALINPAYSLGMSTTGLDPEDDGPIPVLAKIAEAAGIEVDALMHRTRLITGGRETPNAPEGRNQYGWFMEHRGIDLLLTYLSHALAAVDDNTNIQFTTLPKNVAVRGTYGIGLHPSASDDARAFFDWLIDMDAQHILKDGGFSPVHEGS